LGLDVDLALAGLGAVDPQHDIAHVHSSAHLPGLFAFMTA
jgi:hypothetical protein